MLRTLRTPLTVLSSRVCQWRTVSTFLHKDAQTIYSLSSGTGRSAVAVIRMTGSHSALAIKTLTRKQPPVPRFASLRTLFHPLTGAAIDKALVLYFKGPKSFTGEDMVELHVHGGKAIVHACLDAIGKTDPIKYRIAERGEFSRRAYENSKMDLTEVEGVADLINAETELQRMQAFDQMSGRLGALYERWRTLLIQSLAQVEALIDFGEDVGDELPHIINRIEITVTTLLEELKIHLNDYRRGTRIREGVRVTFVGLPNAGKSSLLNLIADKQAAIVSPVPGTTRDIVEVPIDLDGVPVILADTAGMRESSDAIEQEGVRRATDLMNKSDVCILVVDCTTPVKEIDQHLLDQCHILVWNKSDLNNTFVSPIVNSHLAQYSISCKSSANIPELLKAVSQKVASVVQSNDQEMPALTRERHRQHLEQCLLNLHQFYDYKDELELGAESLRQAAISLGRITGRVDVEDMLDSLFSQFCIGK